MSVSETINEELNWRIWKISTSFPPMQQDAVSYILCAESGVYFEQSIFTIKGEFDEAAFERAWQRVVDRHSILRSSFLWEELEKPQQVVIAA